MANSKPKFLGFSTGALYKSGVPINSRLRFFLKLGCNAVELGYTKEERIYKEPFSEINVNLLKKFFRVSLHAPGSVSQYENTKEVKFILDKIEVFYRKFKLDVVVFHPDSLKDHDVFRKYSFPAAVENMDPQKISFQNTDTLSPFFKKHPQWKFVLDINHCYANYRSLDEAKKLWRNFKEKIVEFHVSGFKKLHEPLYKTKQKEFLTSVPFGSHPVIIESTLQTLREAKKEYKYVSKILKYP